MKETDQFRKNRVLTALESLAVRLEVVVGFLERTQARIEHEENPDPVAEADSKMVEAILKKFDEEAEAKLNAAQELADRVNSGEITEAEKEEYMSRWMRPTNGR